jgi:hypothetical protein
MKKIKIDKIDKSIFSNLDLSIMFKSSNVVQPFLMFYEVNKEVGNRINFYNTKCDDLLNALVEHYNIDKKDIISTQYLNKKTGQYGYSSFLITLTKNLWVFHGAPDHEQEGTSIIYSSETPKEDLLSIQTFVQGYDDVSGIGGKIHLIHKFDYGFDLKAYDVVEIDCDIKKHYNDDFEDVSAKIVKRLNTVNDKGLVLLHGKPGTGKTSYIRYLTNKVDKKMIFLSPEVSQYISSPEFITILSDYPNSIIIIEDAENVIKTRKSGGSSAISNLLNLTDGLLADCLKIQLICSFNTDVSQIDKALLRKGRLIAMYEFKELEQHKANSLALSLGKERLINTDVTLADVFNIEEEGVIQESFGKIGY